MEKSSPVCPLCESCHYQGECDLHRRLKSLEANVADHETMIGRMVKKLREMFGGKMFSGE
jgi:hypothetical protein